MDKPDQELRTQESYLTGLISDEQSRWASFNALLDELGRLIEVKTPLGCGKRARHSGERGLSAQK